MIWRTVEEIDDSIRKQLVRLDVVKRYRVAASITREQDILDALLEERSAMLRTPQSMVVI